MPDDLKKLLPEFHHPKVLWWWGTHPKTHGPMQVVSRVDYDHLLKIATHAVSVYTLLSDSTKMVRILGEHHGCGHIMLERKIYCSRCNQLAMQIAKELKS